jgi:hypothetical protein
VATEKPSYDRVGLLCLSLARETGKKVGCLEGWKSRAESVIPDRSVFLLLWKCRGFAVRTHVALT